MWALRVRTRLGCSVHNDTHISDRGGISRCDSCYQLDDWFMAAILLVDNSLVVSLGSLNSLELTLPAANEAILLLISPPSLIRCAWSMISEGAKKLGSSARGGRPIWEQCPAEFTPNGIYAGFRPCRGMLAALRSGCEVVVSKRISLCFSASERQCGSINRLTS